MAVRGEQCGHHTCRMNSLASPCVLVSSLQGIRCLIVVSLLTITSITLHPYDQDSFVTKSIDMPFSLRYSMPKVSGLQKEYIVLSEFSYRCDNFLRICPHLFSFLANSTLFESAPATFICLKVPLHGYHSRSVSGVVVTWGS